jgi:exosome complex exonuclease RRP6
VNDDAPFVLKLRVKHHDSKQKAHSGQILTADNQKREWLSDLDTNQQHPYEFEILNFKVPENQLTSVASPSFKSLEETPLVFVETIEGLKQMIKKLNRTNEFAVDVEHHEYRTFLGLTCLVQISTRDEDFVIDPFPIWDSMHLLNEPFTDPKILKVSCLMPIV